MSSASPLLAPRVHKITPWPVRICAPLAAAVAVVGLLHGGSAVLAPVPVILAAAWVYAGERCGLIVTSTGIESRMTRRENTFRQAWSDIDGFELVENSAQVAIVTRLRDGSRKVLPSTRAWLWGKGRVKQILTALRQEQAAARTDETALVGRQ